MKKTNRSQVRQSGKRIQVFKSEANLGSARLRAIPFALAIAFGSASSFADPAGAVVAAGQAAVSAANGITTVHQMSDRAVLNWQSFNVNAGEAVKFVQPSSTAAILNRVTGGSVSNINGLVEGNGRVYLINPNGIVVGANGVVNVNGGFVASTKSLADSAFMSGGALVFTGESTGSIQILGKVQSAQGDVILIAPKIAIEKTGSLVAGQTIKLVAANEVELSNGKFTVKPKAGDAGQLTVEGALEAAKVQLAANNNNLGALAINTTGTIRATGTQINSDGSVSIIATGEGGNINLSGKIRSEKGDGNGGAVTVLADNAIRVSGTIDANSTDAAKKGGDIIIGRDIVTGKLAKATDLSGATLLSNKGFVETSAHLLAVDGVRVKASNWLLDPDNIDITGDATTATAGYSKIRASDIVNTLNGGTSVTISTTAVSAVNQPAYVGATATGDGNILVNAAIAKTSGGDASLTLLADNGITVNQAITSITNKLNVNLTAKGLGASSQGLVVNKSIHANGGTVTLTGTATGSGVAGVKFNGGVSVTAKVLQVTGTASSGQGIVFSGINTFNTESYSIKGISSSSHGVYFSSGTSTFNSTSTTTDSLIEATKTSSGGDVIFAYNGVTINLNSGAGKASMATSVTNLGGGIRLGYAGGSVVNTTGDITIGSHNSSNSFLMNQGLINAISGKLTLKGQSSGNGIYFQDGGGWGAQIIGTNGAKISLDGISAGSGDGIRLALFDWAPNRPYLISSSGVGGSVTLNGTSSQGNGVFTGRAQIIGNDGNSISIIGTGATSGTGAGAGVYVGEAITANGGGNITINGSTNSGNVGVLLGDKSKVQSMAGQVAIEGYSKGGIGAQLQGIVYADKDIIVKGDSDSTTLLSGGLPAKNPDGSYVQAGYAGVLMQNSVESNSGNITVTGTTKSLVTQAVQMAKLPTTGSSGALKTNASNKIININADSLDIGSTSTVNAGNTGTTNIKTTSLTRGIRMGGSDTNARLGIDNAELNRITAGNLVIGDTNSTGMISFESAVATLAQTGNITLQTGGDIQFGYSAPNYGSLAVDPTKTLTLNAAGSNSFIKELYVNPANFVKASNLQILGSNADVTLTNKYNEIGTLAANVKSINFMNKGALTIGVVQSVEDIRIATDSGDLTIDANVKTNSTSTSAILLNAGESKNIGTGTGGNILVNSGILVEAGLGGIVQLMTGSVSGSGSVAALASPGHFRYNSDETNTNYTAALGSGINIIYREKPSVTLKVDDVIKLYNSLAFNGGSVSRFLGSSLGQNNDSAFAIGGGAKFSGNAQGAINVSPTAYVISAADEGKSALGYEVSYENGSLMITYSGENKAPTPPETYTRIAGDVVNLAPVSFAVGVAPATAAGDEADPNICYAWGQRNGGSVTVHTVLKPSYLGLRHAKTDTQEAMSNSGGSSSHAANPCENDVATNLAEANSL